MIRKVIAFAVMLLFFGMSIILSTGITEVNNSSRPPPSGPNRGVLGEEYTFCIDLPINPDCEPYFVLFDWGDGYYSGWLGSYGAGETVCANHSWNETGTYEIRVKIRDSCGNEYWSDPLVISIGNHPPGAPTINGPKNGRVGIEYEYTFNSTDDDGDDVIYFVNWGDGSPIEIVVPIVPSGTEAKASHKWDKKGTYGITAKTKDAFGAESKWSEPYSVTMPRNKQYINTPFQWFLQSHPNLFLILRLLLQRLEL